MTVVVVGFLDTPESERDMPNLLCDRVLVKAAFSELARYADTVQEELDGYLWKLAKEMGTKEYRINKGTADRNQDHVHCGLVATALNDLKLTVAGLRQTIGRLDFESRLPEAVDTFSLSRED